MSGGHFTTDELRAFARGEGGSETDELAEHCRACVRCGDQLAVLLMLAPAASAAHRRAPVSIIAGIVLVGILALVFQSDIVGPLSTDKQLAALATTETLPPAVVQFHVRLSSATKTSGDRSSPQILEGGEFLASGEYAEAIVALERQRAAHPDSRLVASYLGIARYLAGDDSPAVAALLASGAADSNVPASLYAKWYLGNYLLRTGQLDEAIVALEEVVSEDVRLSREAADLLAEIRRLRNQ